MRERLLGGELPLWDPRLGLGRPLLAMVQPAALYPGSALLLLPAPLGLDLFVLAHLALAALGTRALLRALGAGALAASVGGALLGLSGYLVSMAATNGPYATGVAWVPWAAAQVARRPWRAADPRRALAGATARLGLCVALGVLAGDPQSALFALAVCAALALAAGSPREVAIAIALVIAGSVLAAVVALAQLLPAIALASVGRPGGLRLDDALFFSLPPARLLELQWPRLLGAPWSRGWLAPALYPRGGHPDPWAAGIYLGLATPWLALAALLPPRRTRADVALALLALSATAVALGEHGPAFAPVFAHLPGARWFRYPEKYLFVATMCLAALAGRGLEAALARPGLAAKLALLPLSLCALGLGAALARGDAIARLLVEGAGPGAGEPLVASAAAALAIALLAWLPLAATALGRLPASLGGPLVAAVLVADALVAARPLLPLADRSVHEATGAVADAIHRAGPGPAPIRLYAPPTATADWRRSATARGDLDDDALARDERELLVPDCGLDDGLAHLDPYDPLHPPREERLLASVPAARLLALTATRFALLADDPPDPDRAPPGLHPLLRLPRFSLTLFAADAVAPRLYLASEARPVEDAAAAARAVADADADFVPGATAVVEGGEPRRAAGSCALDEDRPERLRFHCEASAPAYAILADAWLPGWRARVDGAEAPLLPANVAMRAVPVPAGRSTVALDYRAPGLRAGAAGSALGLALVALLLALARPREK